MSETTETFRVRPTDTVRVRLTEMVKAMLQTVKSEAHTLKQGPQTQSERGPPHRHI